MRIEIFNQAVKISIPNPDKANDSKKKKISLFSKKSRNNVLFQMKNWRHSGILFMITLTYPLSFSKDGKQVKYHLKLFKRYLKKLVPEATGFWVLEFQKRGAAHFHIVIDSKISTNKVMLIKHKWSEIVVGEKIYYNDKGPYMISRSMSLSERYHLQKGCKYERVRVKKAMAWYIAKYINKNSNQKYVPDIFSNVGRFWGKIGKPDVSPLYKSDSKISHYLEMFELFDNGYQGSFKEYLKNGYKKRYVWRAKDKYRVVFKCIRCLSKIYGDIRKFHMGQGVTFFDGSHNFQQLYRYFGGDEYEPLYNMLQ